MNERYKQIGFMLVACLLLLCIGGCINALLLRDRGTDAVIEEQRSNVERANRDVQRAVDESKERATQIYDGVRESEEHQQRAVEHIERGERAVEGARDAISEIERILAEIEKQKL